MNEHSWIEADDRGCIAGEPGFDRGEVRCRDCLASIAWDLAELPCPSEYEQRHRLAQERYLVSGKKMQRQRERRLKLREAMDQRGANSVGVLSHEEKSDGAEGQRDCAA